MTVRDQSGSGERSDPMRRFFADHSPAVVHVLEPRRLLAAQVSFDADVGVLHVVGDDANDRIDLLLQFGVDGPPPVLGMRVIVRDHGDEIYSGYFLEGQLSEVRVAGEFGDDVISVYNDNSPVSTFVSGDAGNDRIDAYIDGRAVPSRIHGGTGNDMVILDAGPKALDGYVVLGEGGNDTLSGSRLGDTLYGDNESVSPVSIPGDDVIRGGGGNDALFGGAGDDELFGGDGDDMLDGGEGGDVLDGGTGFDHAVVDAFDKFTNVERIEMTT
jgi:Ca2+-binding RTX toxin-like protein